MSAGRYERRCSRRLLPWILLTLSARQADDILKTLNSLLDSYCCNRPFMQMSADGVVVRKDAYGATMTFKLAGLGEPTIDGKSYKEMEESLFISIHTVKSHVYNLYKK